jgi:hypothetical protein
MREICRMHEYYRNSYETFAAKPETKIPVGRIRHRWEDNIKLDIREIECEDVD